MRAILFVLALLIATPAHAVDLGGFMGGVASARDGNQYRFKRRMEQLRRDDERRQHELRMQRLEQQIEENNRIIRERENRALLRRFKHK